MRQNAALAALVPKHEFKGRRMTGNTHRIHGLAGTDTMPDWPPLQVSEVCALLDRYPDLRGPVSITWHSPRPLSAAARVQTSHGEVFIKRHDTRIRTQASLGEEHAFIAHLRAHGLPVPEVLADADGHTAIAHGAWTWEVHALAAGVDRYRDAISWSPLTDTQQARTAGRMLARLHQASEGFTAAQRDTYLLVSRDDLLRAPDLIAAIEAQCQVRPGLADYLHQQPWQQAIAPIVQRHRALQPRLANLPRLWTHNDWHVSNLFWQGSDISSILDFGLAAPTFALYDLATAIERNAIAWMQLDQGKAAIFPQTARALMDGYTEIRPLDAQLLAELLPVVHLDFALSEVEYFHAILGRSEHADVAWHTFFLGHAAWFDSAPGQKLLQALT